MRILPSVQTHGIMGIVGHAGCGHAHSNNGFLQDDSGGLAATLALFQEAFRLPLGIVGVDVTAGRENADITVRTASGGTGRSSAKRGITLQEARLARSVLGQEAIRTQALAMQAFGRLYGQGADEVPVALQIAIANAAMDSFAKCFPERFHFADEGIAGNCGKVLGSVLEIEGVPVSVMALSNATEGGLGPVEELEGNVFAGGKVGVMAPLHLDRLPTIIVEGKVFTTPVCLDLVHQTWLVRAHADHDNPVVAEALMQAAKHLQQPAIYPRDALKREKGGMAALTKKCGDTIVALGQRIGNSAGAFEKTRALAELIAFASQEAGAVSFMSDKLHEIVGGPGAMPGTAAVLSTLVTKQYIDVHVQPFLSEGDVQDYVNILKAAVPKLKDVLPEATRHMEKLRYQGNLSHLCT